VLKTAEYNIKIRIPAWLERLIIKLVLLYRRLRYGYPFRRIPLTQGKFAIVDPEDFDRLNEYKWHISRSSDSFYAVRTIRPYNTNMRFVIKMHRMVLKVPHYMFVDHINHNCWDNRKANLRPATYKQNNRNRRKVQKANFHSKYKGLTWYKREKRWAARIMVDRKSIFLGYFKDEIAAARAYDAAAKKHFGEFAALNFKS
jgi:hypothetical protein